MLENLNVLFKQVLLYVYPNKKENIWKFCVDLFLLDNFDWLSEIINFAYKRFVLVAVDQTRNSPVTFAKRYPLDMTQKKNRSTKG